MPSNIYVAMLARRGSSVIPADTWSAGYPTSRNTEEHTIDS